MVGRGLKAIISAFPVMYSFKTVLCVGKEGLIHSCTILNCVKGLRNRNSLNEQAMAADLSTESLPPFAKPENIRKISYFCE